MKRKNSEKVKNNLAQSKKRIVAGDSSKRGSKKKDDSQLKKKREKITFSKTKNPEKTKSKKSLIKTGPPKKSKHLDQSKYIFKNIWNIFEISQIPTICRSISGKILKINSAAEKLFGYKKNELPNTKTWLQKLYKNPSYRKQIKNTIYESFSTEENPQHIEVSVTTKSGDKKYLLAFYNNLKDKELPTGLQIVQFLDITTRKKAEDESLQQKYLIEQLLKNVPDKIYFKDLNSRFLAISDSFFNTLSADSQKDILGKTDFDIYDDKHANDAFNDEQKIIKTGIPIIGKEEKEIWIDGSEHWVSTTKMPYRDSKGIIVGTFGISRDITEMLRARNLYKESEIRYRQLIDSSPFAILVHQNGKVLFANNACARLVHAHSLAEVIGKNIYDFMPKEFIAFSRKRVEAISKGATEVPSFELKYNCLDGATIDVEVSALPIVFDNLNSILVIANDITEKKLAQKRLVETEKRFQFMFDNHSALMLLIDPETGELINANKAAISFYGYTREELLSKKIFDVNVLPESEIRKNLRESVELGKNNLTLNHRLANGEIRTLEIHVCPITYDNNIFLFSILHDITQRKETEERLIQNDKLLKEAQKIANVGHYILHMNTGVWECSEQLDFIFGNDNNLERTIDFWTKVVHPDDYEMMADYFFNHVIKGKNTFDKEYRIIRYNDKETRWVHGLGNLRFDENGNVTAMFGTIQDITDWKNAELNLLRTQFSVDKAKDMIYWIEPNGKIAYVNEAACKFSGYTKDELQSMYLFDLDKDFPRDQWESHWNKSRASGSTIIESFHYSKDGTKTPVEVSIDFMEFGGKEYHCSYARDITERKKILEELAESEERYKAILGYSPYSLIVQQNNKIIFVNNACIELFACDNSADLLDKNIIDLVHEDYRIVLKNKIDESAASLKPSSSLEVKIVCLDNKISEAEILTVPFILHGINSTLFIIRFIGDIKSKNEQLRKLSRAVNQSSAGILIANKLGIIEYVNPKFSEITGYSSEEAVGQTTRLLKSGTHTKEFYKDLWVTVLSGNEWRGEIYNRKKSGELYWEFDSISAIKDDIGEITHFLAVKEDVTERKKIETDILEAKEEAEEANKVKSSLLANMSHEFRTPLNGILGFTQLLKDFVVEDEVLLMVEKIEKSGKRLMNTLNAVLSLTELETEDFVVQENDIDLTLFCNTIKSNFERFAYDKDLELSLEVKTPHLQLISDESLLTKIVSSICDNAIKYTNKGKVLIQIDDVLKKDNSDYAVINVIDTGIGIRSENHELIFNEFRQLSEGIRRDFEGLGLGLTLANRMARLIEAEISVDSEFGKGSKFSVIIPLRTKSYSSPKPASESDSITIVNADRKESEIRILLVEDNPLNIEVVQRFLSKTGHVKAVRDGKGALKIASEEHFDLLLIDINLGSGIDGTEVLRQLRLQEQYKNTPAVALTGYASDTNKREFLAKGFTGYLAKPFEKKVLINLLKELV